MILLFFAIFFTFFFWIDVAIFNHTWLKNFLAADRNLLWENKNKYREILIVIYFLRYLFRAYSKFIEIGNFERRGRSLASDNLFWIGKRVGMFGILCTDVFFEQPLFPYDIVRS